jgi:hypothetical protein
MAGQKHLASLVAEVATLLVHAAGGRRPHLDECLSQVIHAFYRIPRVTRAVTLLVALTPSGGLLLHLRSRLRNQECPVRQPTFPSRLIRVFYRILPRVIRAVTLLVALTPSGGQLLHLRSRLSRQERPVRQPTFTSLLLDHYLPTPP